MSTINIRDMDYETFVVMSSFAEERVKKETEGFLNELYSDLAQSNAFGNAAIQNIPASATVNQVVGSSIVTQNITSNSNLPSSSVNSIFNKSIVIRNFRQIVTVVQERERKVRQLVTNPIFRYPYILVIYNDDGSIRTVTGYSSLLSVASDCRARLAEGVANNLFEPEDVLPKRFIGATNNILKFSFQTSDFVQSDPGNNKYVMNKLTDLIGIYYFGTTGSVLNAADFSDIETIGQTSSEIELLKNEQIITTKNKLVATKSNIELIKNKIKKIDEDIADNRGSPSKARRKKKNKTKLKSLKASREKELEKLETLRVNHNKYVRFIGSDPLNRLFGLSIDTIPPKKKARKKKARKSIKTSTLLSNPTP